MGSHRFGVTARVDTRRLPSLLQPRFPPGFFFGERSYPTWEVAMLGHGLQGWPRLFGVGGGTVQNAGATWHAKSGGLLVAHQFLKAPPYFAGACGM
jgi:hypothetical protein